MITTNDDARSVAVLSQHPEDNRGGGSYFATTTEDTETVLVFDVEDDGLLLQVVHNSVNASPPGLCASATAARLLQLFVRVHPAATRRICRLLPLLLASRLE